MLTEPGAKAKCWFRPLFRRPAKNNFMSKQRNPFLGLSAISLTSAHQSMFSVRPSKVATGGLIPNCNRFELANQRNVGQGIITKNNIMTIQTFDLTKQAPRSPRVRLGGFVILRRCLDKGRAT